MRSDTRFRTVALLFVALLLVTLFRLWFASTLEVAPDEAYYYQWSKTLALVYRDHPPMVAWAMRLGQSIFGETALGLRFVAVVLSAAAALGVFFIGLEMNLSLRGAALGAAISTLLVAPASAAVICTPDTFVGTFYLFAVLALLRYRRSRRPLWLYAFAVTCALGFWSKHAALLIPLIPIAVGLGKRISRVGFRENHWDFIHLLFALLLGAVLIAPYIAAEAAVGFPSFSLQAAHLKGELPGASDTGPLIAAARIGEVLCGQIGLLSPLVAVFLGFYLARVHNEESALLKTAVLLPMAVACVAALFTHPEQNWAALGHPMVGPMAVFALHQRYRDSGRRRYAWKISVFASVLLIFAVVHIHSIEPFLPLPPKRDPTSRLHGWGALSSLAPHLNDVDAVVCDNYGLAAQLDWHLRYVLASRTIVTSPDRGALPPPGDWLILSQEDDFGLETLDVRCSKKISLGAISLERPDGRPWDRVSAYRGKGCLLLK